jgi:hypothetical protein
MYKNVELLTAGTTVINLGIIKTITISKLRQRIEIQFSPSRHSDIILLHYKFGDTLMIK